MNICAAADVHYPREGHQWSAAAAETMCGSGADVIVLAGDIAVGERERYAKFLSLFDDFPGLRLFVPGNHDLWGDERDPDTSARYDTDLRSIVEACGFHYLPGAPICVEGVGFVGAAGWHDYGFSQRKPPRPGLCVTPMRAVRGEVRTRLLPIGDRKDIAWEDLTDDDYAGQALLWDDDGRPQNLIWNDAIYTDWRVPDRAVVDRMLDDLRRDVDAMPDACDQLIGVCHFVPFDELLDDFSEDIGYAYCRAYMGSPLLGEFFLADPRFSMVLCGHSHTQRVLEREGLVVANCSVGDKNAGPLLLTLPTGARP